MPTPAATPAAVPEDAYTPLPPGKAYSPLSQIGAWLEAFGGQLAEWRDRYLKGTERCECRPE
jgi:hypothetical protein